MTQNLKLPICPQCNNTKYVQETKCIKMIHTAAYECLKCNINWSIGFGKDFYNIEKGRYI